MIHKIILNRYKAIRNQESGLLNRGRIAILVQLLCAFSLISILLFVLYCFQERNILLARISILMVLFISGLIMVFQGVPWKKVGHYFICTLSCYIWSNMLVLEDGINMVTIQLVLMIVSGSYYILGLRWGLIYSLANALPVVLIFSLNLFMQIDISVAHRPINIYSYHFSLIFNFLLFILVHYYFFKAFKKTSQKEKTLTADLKKTLRSAEKMASAKTNFLATMSHELRTPLNAVIGMTNVLLEDNPSTRQKENLEILNFSAENLMSTINDILSFNRLDAGMEQLENAGFRLDQLLKNVYGALKQGSLKKDLEFVLNLDERIAGKHVLGDQTRLTQILFNLVGNAIKFTTEGYVRITAKVVFADQGLISIRFDIEDSGIGIPESQQRSVFEPYFRAEHRASQQFQGTGLGLSISRRLVDLHGGELTFSTQEGVGTVFSFELAFPEIISDDPQQTGQLPADMDIGQMKILIAEDNPVNVLVLQKTLIRWGLVADVAENGLAAVNAVQQRSYDLIFMDINMPVMGGFEASRQIRAMADPEKNKVCIYALTASIGMSIEEHPELRYLDDFLLKPFSPDQLKLKLEQAARARQSNYQD